MAPPDNLNYQSKGKSAISTSKTIKVTDFQSKKQRLSDLRKKKVSETKPAKVIQPSFPNLNNSKSHLSLNKLQKMETAYFALFLLHRVFMTPSI
jgi:hypothetical protein